MLEIFKKKVRLPKANKELATVSLPDIKSYLIREYNRSRELEEQISMLEAQLKESYDFKIKLDAALVTLEEYRTRIGIREKKIAEQREEINKMHNDMQSIQDELYSYRIRINDAAITRSEIINDVVSHTKAAIIKDLGCVKGNLSKALVRDIVNGCQPRWEEENE